MTQIPDNENAGSFLKVATYNIHRCIGTDGKFDPGRISQVIKQLDADIVALQEVESFVDGGSNILQIFETESNFITIAGPTMYRTDSSYGNAILTRHQPIKIAKQDISIPGREPRGVISLLYVIGGFTIHILSTHLGLNSGERRWQINTIFQTIEQQAADISILMGDVNEWLPWSGASRSLNHLFGRSNTPATFPSRLPLFALDQIRAKPGDHVDTVYKLASPLTRKASDHLPVCSVIWLK